MRPIPYWSLSGFYFFHFAFIGAFAPYWSLYLKSLSFSAFQIGMLMSLLHVTRVFAPAAWGWLPIKPVNGADRTLAAVMGLISYCGVFFGESFAWMATTMALMSFFGAHRCPDRGNHAFLSWRKHRKYGRIRAWGSLGFIFAVISVGYLLDAMDIGSLLWAVLASSWYHNFLPANSRCEIALQPADNLSGGRYSNVLKYRVFCCVFADGACSWPYYTFYSIYLVELAIVKVCRLVMGNRRDMRNRCILSDAPAYAPVRLETDYGFQFQLCDSAFLMIGWEGVANRGAAGANTACRDIRRSSCYGDGAGESFLSRSHQDQGQALYTSLTFGLGGASAEYSAVMSGSSWGRVLHSP